MPTASREIVVSNKLGLHARPAMQFVDVANQFQSKVTVFKGGEEPCEADGKSVMQMIILAATEGTPIRIDAEGEDAIPTPLSWRSIRFSTGVVSYSPAWTICNGRRGTANYQPSQVRRRERFSAAKLRSSLRIARR